MNNKYKNAYNKRAFNNHIRRTSGDGTAASLFYIILLTIGLISFLCLMISEEIKYPFLCSALLFACGDYFVIKDYLESKKREREQEHKQE